MDFLMFAAITLQYLDKDHISVCQKRPVYVRICSLEVQKTASSFGWTDDVLFNQQSEDGWKVLLGIKPHSACLWCVYFSEVCSGSDKMKQKYMHI